MTFDQIEFFMSCAACLNFSLAAKYHFVSVSTLSRSITAMEEELGVKLFDRGYHGHKLTDAGRDFFKCCVNNSIELNKYLMKWSKHGREFLYIGCHPFDSSFEKLINCYSNAAPDYLQKKIKVNFIPENMMLHALSSGYINVGIVNSTPESENIRSRVFLKDAENELKFIFLNDFDESTITKLSRMGTYLK